MQAEKLYQQLGEESSPEDNVVVIDKNSGLTYTILNLKAELHEDNMGRTIWLEVEEQ